MCFSAGASFGAAALIGSIGIVAIAKAKSTPQRLFATIPFVFAVQQLSEGMLWLSLKNPNLEPWQPFFTYTFLIFAMMIWPIWIPLTIRMLEKNVMLKKMLDISVGTGIVVTVGVGIVLLCCPVQVMGTHHHLHYMIDFPTSRRKMVWLFSLLYFISTIIAPFISSIKRMKGLGIVFLASYIVAIISYSGFVVSVWCYFAAILSIIVLWILAGIRKMTT